MNNNEDTMVQGLGYLKDNELFKVRDRSVDLKISDKTLSFLKRTKLVPTGKPIDIRGSFDWKNRGTDIAEVPSIILEEKTLSMTGMASTLVNIYNTASQAVENFNNKGFAEAMSDPYGKMYVVENTGADGNFQYILPWLQGSGGTIRDIRNSWSDTNGNKSGKAGSEPTTLDKMLGVAGGIAAGAASPGWGMEPILSFTQTTPFGLTLKFPLYNTFDVNSTRRNFDFVNLLTYQNLKNRTSLVTYVPPSVYTVSSDALGGVYMPLAYIENLKIESIGTVRRTDEIVRNALLLIPEAYMITISLREMITQSTNIFEGAMGSASKVEVVSNASELLNATNSALNRISSVVE
jgi:hypothetical protein